MKNEIIRNAKGFVFRPARLDEVGEIVALEKEVWGESGASAEQIIVRIETFSVGNFVATKDSKIVAFGSLEIVPDITYQMGLSWDEATDKGFIKKSHNPDADYIYGVDLSVHHSMNGFELGHKMIFFSLVLAIALDKKGVFAGSRIPGFKNYLKHDPSISAWDYVMLKRNGRTRDYEVSVYESQGFKPIKILPDYFVDESSLNYGLLVLWTNPFFGFGNELLADKVWSHDSLQNFIDSGEGDKK